MYRLIIALLICTFFSCKSAEQKDCENRKIMPPLKISNYEELISFNDDTRDIGLLVLDGTIIDKDILNELIFSNKSARIVDVKSLTGATGSSLDGKPKRVVIISSNLCKNWKVKKGELIIK